MTSPQEIGVRIRTARGEQGWDPGPAGCRRGRVAERGRAVGNRPRWSGYHQLYAHCLGAQCRRRIPMYGRDRSVPGSSHTGDELAVLRLYRQCTPDDRQLLLRMARRLVKAAGKG